MKNKDKNKNEIDNKIKKRVSEPSKNNSIKIDILKQATYSQDNDEKTNTFTSKMNDYFNRRNKFGYEFSNEVELDIRDHETDNVPSSIKHFELAYAIEAHQEKRQTKINELERYSSQLINKLIKENSNTTTQASLNLNESESNPLYLPSELVELEKLDRAINPNEWSQQIEIKQPSKRQDFLNSARSMNGVNSAKASCNIHRSTYKEDVRPVSQQIYTPFIQTVKNQNQQMVDLKENMKKELMKKLEEDTECSLQAINSDDKVKFIKDMILEFEKSNMKHQAELSILDNLKIDLFKFKTNQTNQKGEIVNKCQIPEDLAGNNNQDELLFLNLDSQQIIISVILVVMMLVVTLMINMFFKSAKGIIMQFSTMAVFSQMLQSCLTVKLQTELRVYQKREQKNNIQFQKFESTILNSLIDKSYACSEIKTLQMYNDHEQRNFFVDANFKGEHENLFLTTDESQFKEVRSKLQKMFRGTVQKDFIITESPQEEQL